MTPVADLLPGTLELLILKALSLGPHHGYGVLLRIEQISRQSFRIEQGALYPALHRLEHQGHLASHWQASEHNRRAKYYTLTALGDDRLNEQTARWNRLVVSMATVLAATLQET